MSSPILNPAGESSRRADDIRLAAVPAPQAARFREALQTGGYSQETVLDFLGSVEMRSRGGQNLPRLLHLTSGKSPLATLIRLFLLGAPAGLPEARAALSPVPVEEWAEAGLLEISHGSVRSLVAMLPFDGLLLVMDPLELLERGTAADFVSGLTNSSASLATFAVRRPARRALDLGTGSGILAFVAAGYCERVWATDVNPRAIRFAQFNAALNGISNVEFACGSTFEPVAGRKFDLILTNPPCILGPANRYTFRDSGLKLDEFCRRLISETPGFLEEGGYFQCTIEWPNLRGEDWTERLGSWFRASGCDALVLRLKTKSTLAQTEETIFDTEVTDPDARGRLFQEQVDYFEREGVETVSEGLIALRRRSGAGPNWTRFEDLPPHGLELFGDAIVAAFEVHDLLEGLSDEALLEQKLLAAPGLVFESKFEWTGSGWGPGEYLLRQTTGFGFRASVDSHVANVIRRCDGTTELRRSLLEMAAGLGVDATRIMPGCLGLIRRMIERGFLLPEKKPS